MHGTTVHDEDGRIATRDHLDGVPARTLRIPLLDDARDLVAIAHRDLGARSGRRDQGALGPPGRQRRGARPHDIEVPYVLLLDLAFDAARPRPAEPAVLTEDVEQQARVA